jgi:hypothetical protein
MGTLAVRRRIPPLPLRHLIRLPTSLQSLHQHWTSAAERPPTLQHVRRRSRRLALGLLDSGEEPHLVELHLMRFGVHPALAHESTAWATSLLAAGDSGPAPESVSAPGP